MCLVYHILLLHVWFSTKNETKEVFVIFGLNLHEYILSLQRIKGNGNTVVHYNVGAKNFKNMAVIHRGILV